VVYAESTDLPAAAAVQRQLESRRAATARSVALNDHSVQEQRAQGDP